MGGKPRRLHKRGKTVYVPVGGALCPATVVRHDRDGVVVVRLKSRTAVYRSRDVSVTGDE